MVLGKSVDFRTRQQHERQLEKESEYIAPVPEPAKRKRGTPRGLAHSDIPLQVRDEFWSSVDVKQGADCWPWKGRVDQKGYGTSTGTTTTAHRIAYVLGNGADIPPGKIILHKCDNPVCCNPAHLQAGTYRENYLDMVTKGRGGRLG